jgi:hypothetical protein
MSTYTRSEVVIRAYEADEPVLDFKYKSGGASHYFTVSEPYLTKYTEWKKFMDDPKGRVGVYSGSGACRSGIERKNGRLYFTSDESGMGNDTTQLFKCPEKAMLESLGYCIEILHAAGLVN